MVTGVQTCALPISSSSTPIYSGEAHGSFTLAPGAALSLPNTSSSSVVLGEALQDFHAPPSPPPIVLLLDGVFLNLSLSPCWIKAWETSLGCTCVERGGDLDHDEYDSFNPVLLNASA